MTTHVAYQKIGQNRAKPRLWMEGYKLSAAGFVTGARYTITHTDRAIVLRLDAQGDHKVSGRTKNTTTTPIIDLTPNHPAVAFGPETRIRVLFQHASITIAIHHEAQARQVREAAFRTHLRAGHLREASMFTGGGISTHAIHTAIHDFGKRSDLAWVVDLDSAYLDVAARNTHAITDATTLIVGRAEEIEPAFFQPVDVLSFSMPCSSFSRAGKAKHGQTSEEHDGGTALFGTMAAIKASNAAVLVSENVVEAKNAPAYLLLKAELVRLGYAIQERVMDTKDTGTLENRKRYWLVAISEGLAEGFDLSSVLHKAALEPRPTIASILDSEVDEGAWFDPAYFDTKASTDAAAGKNFVRQVLTGDETVCGTIGRHYNKRRSTEPFLQRHGTCGTPRARWQRLFSPREHARVKSVPEGLIAGVNKTRAHEILGQSVDWRQAYVAMGAVLAHVLGHLGPNLVRAHPA